ncbi:MAG: hypothetical protein V7K21_04715 [Nostoc sp.]|uniref:hypothetical protein n=1 Tax=Nostoc sp. TaxID=1180 RepID=UPI002FF859E0
MSLICGNSPLAFVICPMTPLASPVKDAARTSGEPRQRSGSPMPIKCLLILQSTTGMAQQVVDWLLDRIPN